MKQISIPGWIFAKKVTHVVPGLPALVDGYEFQWWPYDSFADQLRVGPHTLTFELPTDWQPLPQEIDRLLAERQQVSALFNERLRLLDAQLVELRQGGSDV